MLHPVRKRLVTAPYRPQHVSLFDILVRLGLQQNLRLCLDAGSGASAPPAATKWLDLSGNGHDFFRGTTGSADATDPVFNGNSGGLSATEFWSFDGGDFFRYDGANETWMQNLHKANAKFTITSWIFGAGADTNNSICGSNNNVNTSVGMYFRASSAAGTLLFQCHNGSASPSRSVQSSINNYVVGEWNFCTLSVDEAANTGFFQINNRFQFIPTSYTSPSSGNAGFTFEIGARGNAAASFTNGGRMANVSIWEGLSLAPADTKLIYDSTCFKFSRP